MAKSYFEVLKRASSFLTAQGKEGHAILFVFLQRKQWDQTQWLLHMKDLILPEEEAQIQADVARLLADYPPQYLLGYADFYQSRFKVTEDTLIPRPETEELVDLCLQENADQPRRVVDVGTGSGSIAISLKKARPTWQVTGVDLSAKALAVAQENATNLQTEVQFVLGDLLQPITFPIEILIANPPYISEGEWALMDASVRRYEPKLALFAENDGLAIYQRLAKEAQEKLAPFGKIYLEIGFRQGAAVQEIFQAAFPHKTASIRKDLFGQERMIIVT